MLFPKLFFIFIILIVILLYSYTCVLHTTFRNNIHSPFLSSIKIITYNVQRLPFLFRPNVDVNLLFEKSGADILCLQEDFGHFYSNHSQHGNQYNVYHPGLQSKWGFTDSGLTIYSKQPFHCADFIPFTASSGADSFAEKGFAILTFQDFILINTHLQSEDDHVIDVQLQTLSTFLQQQPPDQKIIIVGDFNRDLVSIPPFQKEVITLIPHKPTFQKYCLDGGMCKHMKLLSITNLQLDPYADHEAVMIELSLNKKSNI